MERHLRGLGECGEQDEYRERRVERIRHDGRPARGHRGEARRPGRVEEQHARGEQREAAGARHDQRL
jgi:hypothetical protein